MLGDLFLQARAQDNAGGITSAAIDGIKIFEFIGKNFHKPEDFC